MIVFAAGMMSFLGTGFYSYSRGIFLPSLADALDNGERFNISMGFSLAAVTGAIVAPYLGKILDQGSPKKVMICGVAIVSASYLMLANVQNLLQYYVVVTLGMGMGMVCMGGMSWHRAIMNWFDHWRGRSISLAVMGASLAGVMMPPLVTALVETYDWRITYMIFAGSTLSLLLPIVILLMRDHPSEIDEVRDGRTYVAANPDEMVKMVEDGQLWTAAQMFRSPAFWSIGFIFGSMVCVFSAVMLHLYGHLLDVGISSVTAALILSCAGLFAALGKPVVGYLSDYFGARITIWLALFCQCGALLIFSTTTLTSLSFAAACLYGFGYSGMSPLRTFAISTAIGSRSFATATGVIRFVELPFVLAASPIAGLIYDRTGSYQLAFLILAGLMAVAALGPLFIPAGGRKARHERKQQLQQS